MIYCLVMDLLVRKGAVMTKYDRNFPFLESLRQKILRTMLNKKHVINFAFQQLLLDVSSYLSSFPISGDWSYNLNTKWCYELSVTMIWHYPSFCRLLINYRNLKVTFNIFLIISQDKMLARCFSFHSNFMRSNMPYTLHYFAVCHILKQYALLCFVLFAYNCAVNLINWIKFQIKSETERVYFLHYMLCQILPLGTGRKLAK